MKSSSALGGLGILGIGIASAAVLFVAHRSLDPGAPMPQRPVPAAVDAEAVLERAPARDERQARADGAGDEAAATSDVHATEAGTVPEAADAEAAADADAMRESADESAAEAGRGSNAERSPHVEALSHPSAEYRNASLAAVIREAGHHCTGVLSSAAGHEDLGSWRVSCEGGRAYLVFEERTGALRVEPLAYFDAPVPFVPLESPNPTDRVVPLPE